MRFAWAEGRHPSFDAPDQVRQYKGKREPHPITSLSSGGCTNSHILGKLVLINSILLGFFIAMCMVISLWLIVMF